MTKGMWLMCSTTHARHRSDAAMALWSLGFGVQPHRSESQARLWLDEETVWGVSSSRTGDCVQLLTGSGCQPWRTWLPSECGCCSHCV